MKKIYIIPFLIFLFIVVFIVITLLKTPSNEKPTDVLPTPYNGQGGKNQLFILNILPPQQSPYSKVSRNQELRIYFSKPVKANDVVVSVTPYLPLFVRQGDTSSEVFISPDFPKIWEPNNTYVVTISKTTKSVEGKQLISEGKYTLQSIVPIEPFIQE